MFIYLSVDYRFFLSVTECGFCFIIPDVEACRTSGIQFRFDFPVAALETVVAAAFYLYYPVTVCLHLDNGEDTIGLTRFIAGRQRPGSCEVFTAYAYFLVGFGCKFIRLADSTFLLAEQAGDRGIFTLFVTGGQGRCRFVYLEFYRAVQQPIPADPLSASSSS